MSRHAILSASGSHRWLNCLPSARLELEFESQTSEAAREGTAAHGLQEKRGERMYLHREEISIVHLQVRCLGYRWKSMV